MRKLRHNVAASLDGFDTALMGRRTFEKLRAQGTGGVLPGLRTVVFSRTLRAEGCPGITVVSTDAVRDSGGLTRNQQDQLHNEMQGEI